MSIFEFLNKMTSVMQPVLGLLAVSLFVVLAWGYVSREDYEDTIDTVTVTFRCSSVLAHQSNYPDLVINECKNLRNEK